MTFCNHLKSYGGRTSVITDTGLRVTYEQLDALADALYLKINHRCLLFSLCENSIGSVVGYISFLKNKIVPLLLDKNLNDDLLRGLMDIYKPEYLYLPNNMIKRFAGFEIVWSGNGYSLLKTDYREHPSLFADLALLLTTSGSTGSPKLVRLSYKNISSNTESIVQYLGLNETEKPITTMPMSYTYGLSIINSHLSSGATILLTSRTLMEKGFWSFFNEQKATSFGGVPYTYEMLKKLRFFNMSLPSLITMTQAGGKLTPELTKEFVEFSQKRNMRFIVMYGQTEATARMSYLPPEYAILKCGSMGIAIPGGEFSLIDDNAALIHASDTVGELVYKGNNVMLGYAEYGMDLEKGDENGGVLVTGDMAKRDSDGFYYITGRKKRFIKLFGNRVNLDEAERLIKTIIPDCACAGQDDHMVVYITETRKANDVRMYISDKIGINIAAFKVKIISEIPKNDVGKTIYSKLS